VLAGIDAACSAGLTPLKVNMVVRRGVNDDCVLEMAERFREREQTLRFIEYMDVGETNRWRLREVVPAAEIRRAIEARWPLMPMPPVRPGEVASRYRYRDGAGEIGFIASVSEPFCGACTRARLSADGKLYTCLFARHGHDLRALLRAGASDHDLTERVRQIWRARHDRYSAERARLDHVSMHRTESAMRTGMDAPKVEMSYIGG
jgi:cyclic pyranopterin phosphate synthase